MTNTPPEVLEKWRKEFETWFCGDDQKTILKTDGAGNYTYMAAYSAWKSFLAGRQTAVIELPKPDVDAYFNHFFDGEVSMNSKCKLAIESQGYRVEVKGED